MCVCVCCPVLSLCAVCQCVLLKGWQRLWGTFVIRGDVFLSCCCSFTHSAFCSGLRALDKSRLGKKENMDSQYFLSLNTFRTQRPPRKPPGKSSEKGNRKKPPLWKLQSLLFFLFCCRLFLTTSYIYTSFTTFSSLYLRSFLSLASHWNQFLLFLIWNQMALDKISTQTRVGRFSQWSKETYF